MKIPWSGRWIKSERRNSTNRKSFIEESCNLDRGTTTIWRSKVCQTKEQSISMKTLMRVKTVGSRKTKKNDSTYWCSVRQARIISWTENDQSYQSAFIKASSRGRTLWQNNGVIFVQTMQHYHDEYGIKQTQVHLPNDTWRQWFVKVMYSLPWSLTRVDGYRRYKW